MKTQVAASLILFFITQAAWAGITIGIEPPQATLAEHTHPQTPRRAARIGLCGDLGFSQTGRNENIRPVHGKAEHLDLINKP